MYTAAGLYTISATVYDGYNTVPIQADGYVAVYDSSGGSVTGAGSIYSPVGNGTFILTLSIHIYIVQY
jgi:hypothetical protein